MKSEKRKKNTQNFSSASREFAPVLHRVCIAAWILKLVPIPIGLWNARLLSRTVTCAVAGDSENVLKSGAALLLLLALTKLFDFVTNTAYRKASSLALHRCKLLLYRRFLSCPLSMLYETEHGQAVEMLNDDFDTVTGKTLNLYPGFFTGLATFAAYFAFLLAQNLPAALSLLGISVLQIIPPLLTKSVFQQNYSDTRDIEADITNCTLEYYHGFDTIKMFGLKQWCLDRLAVLHKDYLKIGNRSEAAASAENALEQLIGNILTFGTYGLMGLFVLQGFAGLDTAVEALALSGGLYAAAKSLFDTIPSFAVARMADKRLALLYEENSIKFSSSMEHSSTAKCSSAADCCSTAEGSSIHDRARTDQTTSEFCANGKSQNSICLDCISCSFEGRQILSDVSLRFSTDQITIVKGANGMGKSTLLKLILGMVKPDAGNITVNGTPSPALPRDMFPGHLFYLPQEDAAFHMSAEELYECVPGIEPETALSLASRFSLTEESLRQPIDTLSGGQRKKVFLALAFAGNPELMFLDEPTNSLDSKSKETLIELLQKRSGGAVIITHDSVFDTIGADCYTLQNASGQSTVSKTCP